MKLTFWGATDDVTGSMTIIENASKKILIDSGLTQGDEVVEKKNYLPLPFNPAEIEAIILTHAHLDHCGFIPRLIKLGFRGQIHCTKATMKLAKIVMINSANLQEDDEAHLLHGFYSMDEVNHAISLFKTHSLNEKFNLIDLNISLQDAGHILGACSVIISNEKTIVFSGDLGRSDDVLMHSPRPCPTKADYIIMESTYGNRKRKGHLEKELLSFLRDVKDHNRIGLIASFAIARGQMLLTLIHDIFKRHPEYKVKVMIDGPMMKEANKIYLSYAQETKWPEELYNALNEIDSIENLHDWDRIKKKKGPLIIISSSGMVSGGRILRHLENWQDDHNAILYLPGYQSPSTAGRKLLEGKRDIEGKEGRRIHWSGHVNHSDAFSSHADQSELLAWLTPITDKAHVFLIHGEEESKNGLKQEIQKTKKVEVTIPRRGETFQIT